MHELAMMAGILETCEREARNAGATGIAKISLSLGERSGVMLDSLRFAFEALSRDGLAVDAILDIATVPLVGHCSDCDRDFTAGDDFLQCGNCGGPGTVVSGQEMQIVSIEIEE